MLPQLLVEDLAGRREQAFGALAARFLHARELLRATLVVGQLAGDVGRNTHRRVDQDRPLDELRLSGGHLHDEAPAEAVADPGARARVEGLQEVVDLCGERPGLLPARAAVAAQVGCEDVEAARAAPPQACGNGARVPVTPWRQTTVRAAGSPHSWTWRRTTVQSLSSRAPTSGRERLAPVADDPDVRRLEDRARARSRSARRSPLPSPSRRGARKPRARRPRGRGGARRRGR